MQKSKKTVDIVEKYCYNENKDIVAALATQGKGEKMHTNRLLGLMRENRHTQSDIAEILSISPQGLRLKLSGVSQFKANEIKILADLYHVSVDYFFADDVVKIAKRDHK